MDSLIMISLITCICSSVVVCICADDRKCGICEVHPENIKVCTSKDIEKQPLMEN